VAGVDPGRAALVTRPYSIAVEEDAAAPGKEATIVLALADEAGAEAFLARVAPLAKVGLGAWPVTVLGGEGLYELGDEVTLTGAALGAADGGRFIVVSSADRLMSGDADLVLQGPKPEED